MYIVPLASLMQDIYNLPVSIISACSFTALNSIHIHIHKFFSLSSCFPFFLPFFLIVSPKFRDRKLSILALKGCFYIGTSLLQTICLISLVGGMILVPSLPYGCVGCYPLNRQCGWHRNILSLCRVSGRASSPFVVVTTLSGVGSVPYLLESKALRVGLNLVPLPLSVWSAPQEVIAEANEAFWDREDLSTTCVCICGSTWNQTQAVNLPLLHSSQISCKGVAWRGGLEDAMLWLQELRWLHCQLIPGLSL